MYIDAGAAREVYGVVTQGRHTHPLQWVTSYKVEVYLSGGWVPVTNEAGSFTFTGNSGIGDTQVWQRFSNPVTTRYVKFIPLSWSYSHMSMRAGLLISPPPPVYTLMNNALSWSEASADCLGKGLQLATVQSASENAQLRTAAAGNRAWIGGTDAASEGTWVWSPSGMPLSYTNWHSGQPDNRGPSRNEDCLEFNWGPSGTSGTGKWNDADCSAYKRKYVCERRG